MKFRAPIFLRTARLVLLLTATLVSAGRSKSTDKSKLSFSKQLNKNVEDLYSKAEQLQDRAFQRVYELQERAQQLQDKAFRRANELEQQSQAILEKATRQAKLLQQEAAHNLGALTTAIEGLPIPSLDDTKVQEEGLHEEVEKELSQVEATPVEKESSQAEAAPVVQEQPITPVPEATTVVVHNKWNNVQERTLPAVVMLGGLAAYVHYGGSFIPLVFLIQIGLFAETASVVNITGMSKWWWFLAAVAATNGHFLRWKYTEPISYGMAVTGLVSWIISQNSKKGGALLFRSHLQTLAATALSLLILVGQSSFWIATLQEYGLMWILYPALLVIVNDTMAYVFGMLFGKHALLPIISPKKTWQGFIGATLATCGVSYPLFQKIMDSDETTMWMHALAIAAYISLVSPFGGFLASIVKRAHGKKDFANWIPGHGGVVDRLDCQVITAPFVYFYLSTFMATTKLQQP